MGTRNLISVVNEGKPVIAQYGQWDGYPSGQGVGVLEFLNSGGLTKLVKNLKKVRFLDIEGEDEDLVNRYDTGNATEKELTWFKMFISRDLGSGILTNVADSHLDEIILLDSYDFGNDIVSCEYVYTINLDNKTFIVQQDFTCAPMKVYKLDNLPSEKQFLSDLEEEE